MNKCPLKSRGMYIERKFFIFFYHLSQSYSVQLRTTMRDVTFYQLRVASWDTWLFWWNSQTIKDRNLSNESTGCVMFTISRDWLRFNFHCFVHIFISLEALYGENTKQGNNCKFFSAKSYWHFHSSCGEVFQTWSIKPTRFLLRRIQRAARLNWWVHTVPYFWRNSISIP